MTPDEIIEAYNVLAQDTQDRAATEAARIGNAQRSLGTLAERVASPSGQTYGLANYTYDRVMRPTINATAKTLAVQGLAAGLENNLSDELRAAKSRYDDARNRAMLSSGSGGGGGGTTQNTDDSTQTVTDPAYYGELYDPEAGSVSGGGGGGGGGGGWGDEPSRTESSFDKQMGKNFAYGTITEREYRTYLRNQGYDEGSIDLYVNQYRNGFNFPM